MMIKKIVALVLILLLILIIGLENCVDNCFECVDYFGNTVYCDTIFSEYGEMRGIQEDGTTIKITSYKKVDKSEVENEKE